MDMENRWEVIGGEGGSTGGETSEAGWLYGDGQ